MPSGTATSCKSGPPALEAHASWDLPSQVHRISLSSSLCRLVLLPALDADGTPLLALERLRPPTFPSRAGRDSLVAARAALLRGDLGVAEAFIVKPDLESTKNASGPPGGGWYPQLSDELPSPPSVCSGEMAWCCGQRGGRPSLSLVVLCSKSYQRAAHTCLLSAFIKYCSAS